MQRNLSVELRPQTLDEFLGCESVIEPIKEGIRQGRIDSTYLFFGPPGCGKTSLARALFRHLNKGFNEYDLSEPDTSELDIDTLRHLIDMAQLNPWIGKYRGIILDEAQKLRADVQSILLKAIEEPCPSTIWFICSSEPAKLSDAIRRRGGKYTMPSFTPEQTKQFVLSTIKKLGGDIDKRYLQTPGPNKQAIAYDLADALVAHEVTSPGFIIRAIEQMITGVPVGLAAQVTETSTVDTFAIAQATAKGNWAEVKALLQVAPRSAAKDIRGQVAGYFRTILVKANTGAKADQCVWAIEQMSALASNQFEEGLIWAATCASLYKICRGQQEYKNKG